MRIPAKEDMNGSARRSAMNIVILVEISTQTTKQNCPLTIIYVNLLLLGKKRANIINSLTMKQIMGSIFCRYQRTAPTRRKYWKIRSISWQFKTVFISAAYIISKFLKRKLMNKTLLNSTYQNFSAI